jgi:hypothetical protein
VIIWAAVSWYSACPIITLNGRITVSDYVDILVNHVHPTVRMLFPNKIAVFRDDVSPIHTARRIECSFEKHENSLRKLPLTCTIASLKYHRATVVRFRK